MSQWLSEHELDEILIDLVVRTKHRYQFTESCSGAQACQQLGLELRRSRLPSGTDGLISGKTILINEALAWQPRIEFTIFHEITHYLLNDDGQHYEFFTSALRKNDRAFKSAIERYCDRGAAEFLLPRQIVRTAIVERGFSVELIEYLAASSGASIVASAIQIASCAPVPCYVLICVFGIQPKSVPTQRRLYAEYVATPRSTKYTLARYTGIPQDHLCYQAWQDQSMIKAHSYVPFRSGKRMPCDAEAACLRDGRVVAILSLGHVAGPGQSTLEFPELAG